MAVEQSIFFIRMTYKFSYFFVVFSFFNYIFETYFDIFHSKGDTMENSI